MDESFDILRLHRARTSPPRSLASGLPRSPSKPRKTSPSNVHSFAPCVLSMRNRVLANLELSLLSLPVGSTISSRGKDLLATRYLSTGIREPTLRTEANPQSS